MLTVKERAMQIVNDAGYCVLMDTQYCNQRRKYGDSRKDCIKCESGTGCRIYCEVTALLAYTAIMEKHAVPQEIFNKFFTEELEKILQGNGFLKNEEDTNGLEQ